MKSLLVRGMIAGLVAGLAYFVFAYVFGEPSVDAAIAYEEQVAARAGEIPGGEPAVSRGVQATFGLAAAAVVFGVATGGLFALVYAVVYGRVGRLSARATAAVTALVSFLVIYLVPFLKYPANPPASSVDGTIPGRTGIYVVMVLFSVALAIGAAVVGRRLAARWGGWNATLAAAGAYVVAVSVVAALLPRIAETPPDFPATVLYDFRLAALGGQVVLWTSLALVFGALVDGRSRRPAATDRPVDSTA